MLLDAFMLAWEALVWERLLRLRSVRSIYCRLVLGCYGVFASHLLDDDIPKEDEGLAALGNGSYAILFSGRS